MYALKLFLNKKFAKKCILQFVGFFVKISWNNDFLRKKP